MKKTFFLSEDDSLMFVTKAELLQTFDNSPHICHVQREGVKASVWPMRRETMPWKVNGYESPVWKRCGEKREQELVSLQ